MTVKSFTKIGTTKTYPVIRVGPEGFDLPYIVALVELHDGLRVLGKLTVPSDLHSGTDTVDMEVLVGYKILSLKSEQPGLEGCAQTFELLGEG